MNVFKTGLIQRPSGFILLMLSTNCGMQLVAVVQEVHRPLFYIEYLLIPLICSFRLFRRTAPIFAVSLLASDTFVLFSQIFPIFDLADLLYLLSFVGFAHPIYIASLLFFFLLVLAIAIASHHANTLLPPKVALLSVLVAVIGTITMQGSKPISEVTWRFGPQGLSASLYQTVITMRLDSFVAKDTFGLVGSEVFFRADSALTKLVDDGHLKPVDSGKVMLIIAESLGVFETEQHKELLFERLTSLEDFEFQHGMIKYDGNTLNAEFRELCNFATLLLRPPLDEDIYGECIPNLLPEGRRSVAIHGAHAGMYNRDEIYPLLGFDEVVFFESGAWSSRCFSFPGACDDEIMTWLPESGVLRADLIYWLTLNAHHPYDKRDVRHWSYPPSLCPDGDKITELCTYYNLQKQLLDGLASLIETGELDDFNIVLVGDHEPRFTDISILDSYFEDGVVPYILLKKRSRH